MAKELTPTPQYVTITVPEGGDPRTAASVEAGFQDCADCLEYLKNHVDDLGAGRIYANLVAHQSVSTPRFAWVGGGLIQATTATAGRVDVMLELPGGATKIDEIWMRLDGNAGGVNHSGVPGTLPTITLYRQPIAGGSPVSVAGPFSDAAGSVGAYEVSHQVGDDSLNHTIVADNLYYLIITGETGANAEDGALMVHAAWAVVER